MLDTAIKYFQVAMAAFMAAFLINSLILSNAYIPSISMEPTLLAGDRVFGGRFAYWLSSPKRGDIIIFAAPDNNGINYVKRVIGLPGEKIEIKNGELFINDKSNNDFMVFDKQMRENWGPFEVPCESYFVMGDNRNYSLDSRYWNNPYVSAKSIAAKVYLRYWPMPAIVR